jgi:PAS domain S-box-containing protein
MAEGFVAARGVDHVEVISAGVTAGQVHPKSIQVMAEADIDISHHRSKTVSELGGDAFDVVITLCMAAKEYCTSSVPQIPLAQKNDEYSAKGALFINNPAYLHWDVEDPAAIEGAPVEVLDGFRSARDRIKNEVERLFEGGYLTALVIGRRQLECLADLVEEAVAIHDENRRFYFFNRRAEDLTGYTREEAIGMDCHALFPPHGLCGGECQFKNLVNPEPPRERHYEVSMTTRDGDEKKIFIETKPVDVGFESTTILATFRDITEISELRWRAKRRRSFHGMVGISNVINEVFDIIKAASASDYPVLVEGESGTGKELVADAIHIESKRKGGPFVPVNCGALPENILESELFGHVRGAFTGAIREKKGRFELADGGTLFLDEVGELSQMFQVRLLRVLQEKQFEKVGGEKPIKVDVRIVAATNRDLREMVNQGEFREDLYFRLCVVPISLPPLRDRIEDIPVLVEQIMERVREESGKEILGVDPVGMDKLLRYHWPGNIRELINALQFASIRCRGNRIQTEHLPFDIQNDNSVFPEMNGASSKPDARSGTARSVYRSHGARTASSIPDAPARPSEDATESAQRRTKLDENSVALALDQTGGNKVKAAKLLGVGRATLYRFLTHNSD